MCNLFIVDAMVVVTSRFCYGSSLTIPGGKIYTFELNCLYLFKTLRINLIGGIFTVYGIIFIYYYIIYYFIIELFGFIVI